MDLPKVSTEADFAEAETAVVTLPRKGAAGQVLTVLIQAVPLVELIKAMEGIPGLQAAPGAKNAPDFAQARQIAIEHDGPSQKIAALGIVAPSFWYEKPEDGKAPWKNVHAENQLFLVTEIMNLSGFSEAPKDGGGVGGTPNPPGAGGEAVAASFRDVAE